ncbi:MAG: lipoate--protein ligase [Bacteroidales bacterium]|nr:lipoate--protein ligase [Bacteroidales bacterium]MCF8458979.1 lipoate--protein ligase [Bacteroidales bacterium]
MLCINSTSNNPYFNLAAEEYFLRNFSEDIFMLYINEPSIIVGKHQNALSEVNLEFVRRNNIKVARRLSGGGTVFHDCGNLNFCFIQTAKDKNLVNFSKFIQPVLKVLQRMGLDARAGDKNDILINGLKISGNAEHIFKQRVLHHGTLLFDSKLDTLKEALKVNLERFTDRSVQSRRSKVGNISDFLQNPLSIDEFRNRLFKSLIEDSENTHQFKFSEGDLEKINQLEEAKFSTWDWNFGYSPKYEFRNTIQLDDEIYDVFLLVEKGRIQKVEFKLNGKTNHPFKDIETELLNQRHDLEDIENCLDSLISNDGFLPLSKKKFLKLLF